MTPEEKRNSTTKKVERRRAGEKSENEQSVCLCCLAPPYLHVGSCISTVVCILTSTQGVRSVRFCTQVWRATSTHRRPPAVGVAVGWTGCALSLCAWLKMILRTGWGQMDRRRNTAKLSWVLNTRPVKTTEPWSTSSHWLCPLIRQTWVKLNQEKHFCFFRVLKCQMAGDWQTEPSNEACNLKTISVINLIVIISLVNKPIKSVWFSLIQLSRSQSETILLRLLRCKKLWIESEL